MAEVIHDVVYSRTAATELRLDLYLPNTFFPRPAPVVLWLHGGGWGRGHRSASPDLARIAGSSPIAWARIDYRLSGQAHFPAPLLDVRAAVRWLRSNAERFELDAQKVGLWGASAGGHLALLAGITGQLDHLDDVFSGAGVNIGAEFGAELRDEPSEVSAGVHAVASSYGPTNLITVSDPLRRRRPEVKPDRYPEAQLLGLTPDLQGWEQRVRVASPWWWLQPGLIDTVEVAKLPAFHLDHGASDETILPDQTTQFHDALTAAGASSQLNLLAGFRHGYAEPADMQVPQVVAEEFDIGRLAAQQPVMAQWFGVGTPSTQPAHMRPFGFDAMTGFFKKQLVPPPPPVNNPIGSLRPLL